MKLWISTITLEALKMAVAGFPTARPRRSTLSLVMIETIFAPSGTLISTSAFTAPLTTAETVPAMQSFRPAAN